MSLSDRQNFRFIFWRWLHDNNIEKLHAELFADLINLDELWVSRDQILLQLFRHVLLLISNSFSLLK